MSVLHSRGIAGSSAASGGHRLIVQPPHHLDETSLLAAGETGEARIGPG
ncbi:MAG: hypothetical protein QOJ59_5452 [Thermomicrobiales bacterium]|jgi:hypothetical protein|nr:hypothetical protein [Thermomicrobiales bacterium]